MMLRGPDRAESPLGENRVFGGRPDKLSAVAIGKSPGQGVLTWDEHRIKGDQSPYRIQSGKRDIDQRLSPFII